MTLHKLITPVYIWGTIGVFKLISYTPFVLLYIMSSILAFFISIFSKSRKITKRNFYRAFPTMSQWNIWKLVFRYYEAMVDYPLEMAKISRFSEGKMLRHCKFINTEVIRGALKEHDFILCMSGHLMNYEMLVSAPLTLKDVGMCHIYKGVPQMNPLLSRILNIRSRYGAVNIPSTSPLRPLINLEENLRNRKSKYKGFILGSLSDMDPMWKANVAFPFLNHKLEVLTGAERIGRKMNMAFVYARVIRRRRGFYEVKFIPMHPQTEPDVDQYAYTREFVRQLDLNIREQPEIWLQWGTPRF